MSNKKQTATDKVINLNKEVESLLQQVIDKRELVGKDLHNHTIKELTDMVENKEVLESSQRIYNQIMFLTNDL